MAEEQIKVLIVDDSPLVCKGLTEILNSDPQIRVVGTAVNGKEAVEFVPKLKPDLICMDINMPIMDGFEATKQIMAYDPTPILIVSTSVFKAGMEKAFKAISFGALDVISKPSLDTGAFGQEAQELINKVKVLSRIKVISHILAKLEKPKTLKLSSVKKEISEERIVGITSSTGGPQALLQILKRFPKNFPCGIVIVQHISSGFVEGLADWLNKECLIEVKIPQHNEQVQPGTAYLAPDNFQLRVSEERKIELSDESPYDGFRPSGNVLFESIAKAYKDGAVGVILTGMGTDGAQGMKTIKDSNGTTIAQDEKTSIVFGMPKAAIAMEAVDTILPLDKIAGEIMSERVLSCLK
ncbi:MAG: chemotaxis response regulator protein-glutamate methylesterase [Candidatus Margulisiibacteriota bacterium]